MHEATSDLTFPAISLIVLGSIIFIIAFFGCCGAIRESHCMIVTFATLLLTILVIQVAVAIYTFVTLGRADDFHLKEAYADQVFYKYNDAQENRDLVNVVQRELTCCGVDSYKDFRNITPKIPGSCCDKDNTEICDPILSNAKDRRGCGVAIEEFFKAVCATLGGIALGIAAVELIGIIFALCLANSIKNAERRGYSV